MKQNRILLLLTCVFFFPCVAACNSTGTGADGTASLMALAQSSSDGGTSSGCSTATTASATTSSTGNYTVVDTNQTDCYDSSGSKLSSCSGSGYDGAYTYNPPGYTLSSGGKVITDSRTGLMWSQSTDTTGDGLVNYSDKMFQSDAVAYCENLELEGYSDWRLPDIKTLYSLIEFSGKDASVVDQTSYDTSLLTPFLDTAYFDKAFGDTSAGDRIIDAQYATSTNYVSTTMGGNSTMFGVNFVDGRIKGYNCNEKKFYVRCVRGNSDYGRNNFSDNGDGTITDNATGLMWTQNDRSSTNWQSAVNTCEGLTFPSTGTSHTDWRLPNAKELQSITDYSRSPDSTSSAALNSIFNATSITNENGATDYGYYWSSTTHVDNNDDATNAVYLSFGRAVGYFLDPASGGMYYYDVHGAGAQRSNDKSDITEGGVASAANLGWGLFYYHGPQGDIQRVANRVLCVRNTP